MGVRILVGHVIEQLRSLPEESVHMVVTSPPYLGLRSYGTPPQVWGGDPDCQHQWGAEVRAPWANDVPGPAAREGGSNPGKNGDGRRNESKTAGQWCTLCSAWNGDLGLEPSPALFIEHLVMVFREVRRVLRRDGTAWINLGDSFSGNGGTYRKNNGNKDSRARHDDRSPARCRPDFLKPKDLMMIPARVAIALCEDGWYLRSDIIWAKPNPMPESVTDRPTTAHEHLFLLAKSGTSTYWVHRDGPGARQQPDPDWRWVHKETGEERLDDPGDPKFWRRINLWSAHDYFYDAEAIKEGFATDPAENYPARAKATGRGSQGFAEARGNDRDKSGGFPAAGGRNKRSVWTIATSPYPDAHFATFPPDLVEPCILAGTSEYGVCGKCGGPWERVIEKQFTPQQDVSEERGVRCAEGQKPMDATSGWPGVPRGTTSAKTLGWQPTCSCGPDAGMRQAVVLDCFGGAGTTAMVADRLKRDAILVELSETYAAMARRRIEQDAGLFAQVATD